MADEAPTTSHSGLARVFKNRKNRRDGSDNNASSNSLVSNEPAADESGGLRSSIEGAFDKLKDRARRSSDDRRNSHDGPRRVSTLLSSKSRRQEKRQQVEGLSAAPSNTSVETDNSINGLNGINPSEESLGASKSDSSSLLTEDSDVDSRPVRPTLSPHQSHAGYLTLSSPLITAETVDPSTTTLPSVEAIQPLDDALAPRNTHSLDVSSSLNRSPSPVEKLKEAFTPSRRNSITPKPAEDTDSIRSAGSANAGGGKSGGIASRRGSTVEDIAVPREPTGQTSIVTKASSTPKPIRTDVPETPPPFGTPKTFVTPPTPTEPRPRATTPLTPTSASKPGSNANSNIATSPSGSMIAHRRIRSNAPSKLSSGVPAPLTPTVEEYKTPGGTLTTPSTSGGFFSSVFSAAQNAANQLTNTINTSIVPGQRNRSGTGSSEPEKTGRAGGEEVIPGTSTDGAAEDSGGEKRQLAVETLGSGNLSLSHLGISDTSDPSPMSSTVDVSQVTAPASATIQHDEVSAKAEDSAAARAVSAAYQEKPNGDKTATPSTRTERPRSVTTLSGGDQSPTRPVTAEPDTSSIRRQGSIRSRISAGKKRRHRGSSAATGATIAAAIGATTSAVANPATGQRLTGFAVANPKRNKDFHQLFRSVPEDDYLIEDYSAALQREILLHGRLYISEGHICFSSNILGWVTNLVISFDEIMSVEKKTTAVIFPNAIVIQTLHARNVFASLVTRDTTYDLIISIWKINHPNLKSSLNGVTLDNAGTGDRTERAESGGSDDESEEGSGDDVYDEDDADDDDVGGSFVEPGDGSVAGSDAGDGLRPVSRKASAAAVAPPVSGGSAKVIDNAEAVVTGVVVSQDYPGPATHAPTDCGDEASHYDKLLLDATVPAPLGKIYSMTFGPASSVFMRKWLIDDQKSQDLQLEDDKQGLGEAKKSRGYSYIKPLSGSIGPKQTKCIITETLEQFDLEKAVTVNCSTQNPDVPSGNIFLVKTRYCLMWAPGNATRVLVTATIEWSGKSWLKGPIEKGTNDGQTQYVKDLVAALRAAVTAKPALVPAGGKTKKGGKARRKTDAMAADAAAAVSATGPAAKAGEQRQWGWGVLEPLRPILGPVADRFGGGGAVLGFVVGMLVLSLVRWVWGGGRAYGGRGGVGLLPGLATPERVAAYEEIWRREESELWRWLEERVGPGVDLDRVGKRVGREGRGMEERVREEGMSERQIGEAIRVTRERLETLEDAVRRKKKRREGEAGR